MADQTVAIDAPPVAKAGASSTVLQIAVLALLAATGTLATLRTVSNSGFDEPPNAL